jgi:hypothetical protein
VLAFLDDERAISKEILPRAHRTSRPLAAGGR